MKAKVFETLFAIPIVFLVSLGLLSPLIFMAGILNFIFGLEIFDTTLKFIALVSSVTAVIFTPIFIYFESMLDES